MRNFPDEWLITATVYVDGGTDRRGNPLPTTATTLEGCVYAPGRSSDPTDLSDVDTREGTLYAPTEAYSVLSRASTVELPIHGRFYADGTASYWPMGSTLPLSREGGSHGLQG